MVSKARQVPRVIVNERRSACKVPVIFVRLYQKLNFTNPWSWSGVASCGQLDGRDESDNVLYCTVLYCTVLYCTVLYCIVLYCTVLYCTILYYNLLYCIVLYCTVVYCTIMYCIVLCCIIL